MIRACLAAAALVLALPSASPARTLDFQRYVHGEVRRDSHTFFCIEEKGAREIVGLINSYANGKISAKDAGAAVKEKTFEYKCNRQDLLHMSLKTLIKGKISDLETVDNSSVWITKDASLVKAQARDGLIVYVITNALVPPPEESPKAATISADAPTNTGVSAIQETKPAPVTDAVMGKVIQHILDDEAKRDNRPPRPPRVIDATITDKKLEKAIQKILKEEDREAREAPPLPEVEETASDEGEKSVTSAGKTPGPPPGPSPASANLKKGQAIKPAETGAPQPEEKAGRVPEEPNDRPGVTESKPAADETPRTVPEARNAGDDLARSPLATSPAAGSDAPESNDPLSGEEKSSGVSKESVGLPEDIPPEAEAPSSSEGGKSGGVARVEEGPAPSGAGPADEKPDAGADNPEDVEETKNPKENGEDTARNSDGGEEEKNEETEKEEAPPAPPEFLGDKIDAAED